MPARLHVFDADRIKGNIHVRLARPGETIAALDGRTYALDPEMTVIADDEDAEAIGGIIGGERSGCTDETVNVFLEAALFDPVRTAATGRKLGVQSDARYRFERGVDPAFVLTGVEIATRMILDLCGGNASELVIAGAVPAFERRFTLDPSRVRTLGGLDVPPAEQAAFSRPSASGVRKPKPDWNARFRAGGRTSGAKPIWSRRSAASSVSTRCRRRPCGGSMRWPARCSRRCSGASWRSGGALPASASTRR